MNLFKTATNLSSTYKICLIIWNYYFEICLYNEKWNIMTIIATVYYYNLMSTMGEAQC